MTKMLKSAFRRRQRHNAGRTWTSGGVRVRVRPVPPPEDTSPFSVLHAAFEPMVIVVDAVRGLPEDVDSFQIDGTTPIEIKIAPANSTHEAKTNAALAKHGLRQALIAAGRPYHILRRRRGEATTITICPDAEHPAAGGAAALNEMWQALLVGGRPANR